MSVGLYRTPYLVDIVREPAGRVLKLDSIEAGDTWKQMDMLIFNTWHWWLHKGSSQGYAFTPIFLKLFFKTVFGCVLFLKAFNGVQVGLYERRKQVV